MSPDGASSGTAPGSPSRVGSSPAAYWPPLLADNGLPIGARLQEAQQRLGGASFSGVPPPPPDQKGYLRRLVRVGQTNRFNLTPLFDALRAASMTRRATST